MKQYQTIHLVTSEDLNVHGTLFAARAASWFVESAFIAAACTFGKTDEMVCRNVHGMEFTRPVNNGEMVSFVGRVVRVGETSMTTAVEVTSELTGVSILVGFVTFVTIDESTGKKKPHNITLDPTIDPKELELRNSASQLFEKN